MTRQEAQQLAQRYLESLGDSEPIAFYDELSQRKPYGWILFYNSKQFIETGNILCALGGNGPLVVLETTREVVPLSTALTVEEGIEELERERDLRTS